MKKIISTCIALMVSAACSISAFAMEVPTNTTIQDLNGVRQYIKIYTVAPDTDPQSLIDDVFEYDGYTYTYQALKRGWFPPPSEPFYPLPLATIIPFSEALQILNERNSDMTINIKNYVIQELEAYPRILRQISVVILIFLI